MIEIGVIDANDMLIETQLSESVYHIGLSWNEEAGQWSLSIRDLNVSVLASGISVVPNWPLLNQVRRPEFPPGDLIAYSTTGATIARNSFSTGKAFLYYVEPADFEGV